MKFYVYYNNDSIEIDGYIRAWRIFNELYAVAEVIGGMVLLVDGETGEIIQDNLKED